MKQHKKKPRYRIRVRITPLAMCAILAVSMAACKTAQATGDAESVTQIAAESSGLTDETQVITLAECRDELPQDEPYTVTAPDELPQDEPCATTGTATITATIEAKTMYETDSEAPEPAKSYNGVAEGSTIDAVITYYDICTICCGKTDGVTASGLSVYNGMTDPHIVSLNWLPLGSIISIGGVEYTVADRGGSGLDAVGRADVFTPAGHAAALALGRTETEITIVKINDEF